MAPYSGYDPIEHGQGAEGFDPVGNAHNMSEYYALAPGGRFPGDVWAYLEGQAAQDPASNRTGYDANPDYNAADWLEHIPGRLGNVIARLVRWHEWNVRNNDSAAVYNPLRAGDVYQGWSGPGASYGPMGGPLHGLLDQGNDHLGDFDYGGEPGASTQGEGGRRRGGGGGNNFGPLNYQPYTGVSHNASFVDWQPTQPFTVGGGPARMVTRPLNVPPVAAPQGRPPVAAGGGRGGRGSGGSNAGGGGGRRAGSGRAGSTGSTANDMGFGPAMAELLSLLFPQGGVQRSPAGPAGNVGSGSGISAGSSAYSRFRPNVAPSQMDYGRGTGERGYDTNYLERGTPGWVRDPTTGILNTAGMPRATPPARGMFATDDDWITALHDLGYDNESIAGMMGDWGTGGVVRGPDGYMFANDPRAQESAVWPAYRRDDLWIDGEYPDGPSLSQQQQSDGEREYVATGGGGGGLGQNPESASTMLSGGWNPHTQWL